MSWLVGTPIELYRFTRGPETWLLSTGRRRITLGTDNFDPDYVKRENIRSTGDKGREKIVITMANDHPIVAAYAGGVPGFPTTVSILRTNDNGATVQYIWSGRVVTNEFVGNEGKLNCEPISTTLKRLGLRRPYQVLCPLVLYDPNSCRAVDVTSAATVTAISGTVITVAISDFGVDLAGRFAGGKMRFGPNIYFVQDYQIVSGAHIVSLSGPALGLTVGSAVTLSRGCSHDTIGCTSFSNLDNYGGYPYMPQRNPFGLNPII